jgi:hypothetical protein
VSDGNFYHKVAFFLNAISNFWLLWAVVRSLLGSSYHCNHDCAWNSICRRNLERRFLVIVNIDTTLSISSKKNGDWCMFIRVILLIFFLILNKGGGNIPGGGWLKRNCATFCATKSQFYQNRAKMLLTLKSRYSPSVMNCQKVKLPNLITVRLSLRFYVRLSISCERRIHFHFRLVELHTSVQLLSYKKVFPN